MLQQKVLLLITSLLTFTASLILALPPGTPWTNFVSKPVYSRAIGPLPSSEMNTISVPFMPKSPFFPKFVDPKMMIAKKTDMLSNLFGGIGPIAYMPDTKPITSYAASETSLDSTDGTDILLSKKRDTLKNEKENIIYNNGMYRRGMLGPFTPNIGPKFGPVMPFSTPEVMSDYMGKKVFSRRRRSIESASSTNDIEYNKSQITDSNSSFYPKKSEITENTLAAKSGANSIPKEYLSGMFGSFMDPTTFTSKKSAFLDTLFKNIATGTPATTDAPVPKSTIVPPNFWMPSSVIPSPTEYTSKVSDFLEKLYNSIKLNTTAEEANTSSGVKHDLMRSVKSDDILPERIARSLEDLSSISAAKDEIADAILSELSNLKADMMATLDDLIAYEKTASAAVTAKKPFKPFPSMWPKPTMDMTLPFQQRMTVLSQVFDTLTDLQRNITAAVKDAIMSKADTSNNSESPKVAPATDAAHTDISSINTTFLDAILKKLSANDITSPISYPTNPIKTNPIMSKALPEQPTPFWLPYPENIPSAVKRQADDSLSYMENRNDDIEQHDRRQYARNVKMQLHQGYQSLPAGSVESVQAGGGSTPEHQGGGIELLEPNNYENLNKWADWMQYHKNKYEDHRHHHNHR